MNIEMIAIKIYLDRSLIETDLDENYLQYITERLSEPP